jgi:hypothetical protein
MVGVVTLVAVAVLLGAWLWGRKVWVWWEGHRERSSAGFWNQARTETELKHKREVQAVRGGESTERVYGKPAHTPIQSLDEPQSESGLDADSLGLENEPPMSVNGEPVTNVRRLPPR